MHALSGFSYGKDDVRLLRIVRDPKDRRSHCIVEYKAQCLLSGSALETSYTQGDNTLVVATDSVKNTINLLAKKTPGQQVLVPEEFALVIARHFFATYKHIERIHIELDSVKWSRLVVDDKVAASSGSSSTSSVKNDTNQHPHSFIKDGEEKRFVVLDAERGGKVNLDAGIRDLVLLKSSGSAFHGFVRDQYTTLPDVHERIFSTSVDCRYSIGLPSDSLTSDKSALPAFDDIASAVKEHVIRTFATHESASVQATMFETAQVILNDNRARDVQLVDLQMPNRHYIPIDLKWANVDNLSETDAEVFLPSAHPSGLIKATIARQS